MRETSTRREEIIAAAFALTDNCTAWTLAEVAARVGVSKPALYRHFKNKEEIEAVMAELFRDKLLAVIDGSDGTQKGFRLCLRDFFRDNAGFLGYFMTQIFAPGCFEEGIYGYLLGKSERVAQFHKTTEDMTKDQLDKVHTDILKNIVSVILASVHEPGIETMQDELLEILEKGLPALEAPTDERLNELDEAAVLTPDEFGKDNRLFAAIAASVKQHGFAGTTTERIAEKMGITKSSLYFYYPTKDAMFEELMKTEHDMLLSLCAPRILAGKTLTEQLYSLMAVTANYLVMRPDIHPVFNWIRFESIRENQRKGPHKHDDPPLLDGFRVHDLFPEDTPEAKRRVMALIKWFSILTISTVLQGDRKKDSPEQVRNKVRLIFRSALLGDRASDQ